MVKIINLRFDVMKTVMAEWPAYRFPWVILNFRMWKIDWFWNAYYLEQQQQQQE